MQEPKEKETASNRRRRTRAEAREAGSAEPASPPEQAVVEREGEEGPAEPASLPEQAVVEEVSGETAAGELTLSEQAMAKIDGQVGEHHEVNGSGLHHGNGITRLLYDHEFIDQVVKAIVDNGAMDKLAGDISGKLHDQLADSPEFGRRLIDAVMSNERFRGRLVTALITGLS